MNNNSQFLLADLVEELKSLNKKLSRSNKIYEEGFQKIADALHGKRKIAKHTHDKACKCQSRDPLSCAVDQCFKEIFDE